MQTAFRKINTPLWLWSAVIGLLFMSDISPLTVPGLAREKAADNQKVKILTPGVDLIELTPSAAKCGKQNGETIRLRVTSENPVDVRLYVHIGWKQWLPKDFPNQKRGDEINDYRCGQRTDYKVYARAAGSSEAWPNL